MPISAERADRSIFPCHTFRASLPIFQVTSHHHPMLHEQEHPFPCTWTRLCPAHHAAAPKSALQHSFRHSTTTSLSVLFFQKIPLIYVVTTTACCLITQNVCGSTGTCSGDGAPWGPSVTWRWLQPPTKATEPLLTVGVVLSISSSAPGPPCSPGICIRNFLLPSATGFPFCGKRITEG